MVTEGGGTRGAAFYFVFPLEEIHSSLKLGVVTSERAGAAQPANSKADRIFSSVRVCGGVRSPAPFQIFWFKQGEEVVEAVQEESGER